METIDWVEIIAWFIILIALIFAFAEDIEIDK